jgi:hypothetical protein
MGGVSVSVEYGIGKRGVRGEKDSVTGMAWHLLLLVKSSHDRNEMKMSFPCLHHRWT